MLTDRPAYASFDTEMRFAAVNDRLLAFLGKTRADLIGRPYLEVYPGARGAALHNLMVEARDSMQAVKRRVWSEPLRTWLDVEVYPLSEGVQVAFTPVAGAPPSANDAEGSRAAG